MLTITSPKLSSIIIVLLPAVLVPIILVGRRVRRLSRDSQDRIADTSAVAGEILGAMPVVQAFTLEGLQQTRFDDAVEESFSAAERRIRTRALLTASGIASVFSAIIAVLWIGTIDVLNGAMTGGELGQFLFYAIIVGGSASFIGEIWGSLQQAAGATERLVELLETESAMVAPANPVSVPHPSRGLLHFENVSFNYPSRPEQLALDGFTLTIEPGESVALVGPSGAGKTTVFQLLLSFYHPSSGKISIDDVDLATATPSDVRREIAIVPQDTVLFAGSVMDNIRYGDPQASDTAVLTAAEQALVTEFIHDLPDGFNTLLGERGLQLSGGQRQRIAIARAILKSPSVLLLDEATSALDTQNESLLQLGIERLMNSCTTIIIAHRLSTVFDADRIVVMDSGKIVNVGTHEELVKRGGFYAEIAALQLQGDQTPDKTDRLLLEN